jgi:hypothetical protein
VSHDIAIWKWRGEPGDPAAVFELFRTERKAHPSIVRFDRKPLVEELERVFGEVLEDDDESPFLLEEIADEDGLGGSLPEVVVFALSPTKLDALPKIAACAARVGLHLHDPGAGARRAPRNRLTVEGHPPIEDPTVDVLEEALTALDSKRGPSFAVVQSSTGDYVQAAGDRRWLTVEWREHAGSAFRHLVAGHRPEDEREVVIMTLRGGLRIRRNEQLDARSAIQIFRAFSAGEKRPDAFAWRDITSRFVVE